MLRCHLQEGCSAIPKSNKPARIAENFDVFDFELSGEQVAAIDTRPGTPEGEMPISNLAVKCAATGRPTLSV
jgi:diketogulonate reductase-like aldo/keto reductase